LALEILLIVGFQVLFGFVYHYLALIIAAFMMGMAVGSWRSIQRGHRRPYNSDTASELRSLALLQLIAGVSALLLFGSVYCVSVLSSGVSSLWVGSLLFPLLAFFSGALGGFQFPLASRIYFSPKRGTPKSPGLIYGLDLAGACAGSLFLSVILLPLYSFLGCAVFIAVLNTVPCLLAWSAGRTNRFGGTESEIPLS
jgi:spermidine synthase